MITTETVSLADVHTDDNNPREDMGDIEALAATFSANFERPGEPFTPVLLVRDGGIYRIVDGERRYRAMVHLGTTTCTATVADSLDDANAMLAMLATDDKKQLSPIELSRGVQQVLLLGIEPSTVAKAARMAETEAYKVRRVLPKVQDYAEDMSLERLLAAEEFAGDAEALERIMSSAEKGWEGVVATLRNERLNRADIGALRARCAERNIPIMREKPEGWKYDTWYSAKNPADLFDEYLDTQAVAVIDEGSAIATWRDEPSVRIYLPVEDAEEDPATATAAAAEREARDAFNATFRRDKQRRLEFIDESLADGLPHTLPLALDATIELYGDGMTPFGKGPLTAERFIFALVWDEVDYCSYAYELKSSYAEEYQEHLNMLDALVADGYEPSPDELALADRLTAFLAERPEEETDDVPL